MRKLIYLILSLVAVPVFAQEEQWVRSSSLGFKGGINQVQNTNAPLSVIIVTHKNIIGITSYVPKNQRIQQAISSLW